MEGEARALSIVSILAGIWLVIAPFVLNYRSSGNVWQEVVLGIIVGVLGIIRLVAVNVTWPSWTNVLIGLWTIIAPWIIQSSTTTARWNEVIVGVVLTIFAYSSAAVTTSHHHVAQQ